MMVAAHKIWEHRNIYMIIKKEPEWKEIFLSGFFFV